MLRLLVLSFILLCVSFSPALATDTIRQLCPSVGIQQNSASFESEGIILTSFDRTNIWAVDLYNDRRYPLDNASLCTTNCHLSPDFTWITYWDRQTESVNMMRLNGDERIPVNANANEITWWTDTLFLIWTPDGSVYLQSDAGDIIAYAIIDNLINVQPSGELGLSLLYDPEAERFDRILRHITLRSQDAIRIGDDRPYFNATQWSPNGDWLAFVDTAAFDTNVNISGGEIYAFDSRTDAIMQWTDLFNTYGAVRINGHERGHLSWSPDNRYIAFWVIELLASSPVSNTGQAVLHVLDVNTGDVTAYCGLATNDHTPNPPYLVWSPDSRHIAFGVDLPNNNQGQVLLALNRETGIFTQLSSGLFPTQGSPSVIAWGILP